MSILPDLLKPIEVKLDEILLDPNNPRFAELGQESEPIHEYRFNEPRIQKDAYDRMKKRIFDVSELRDTIKTLGFLPMDRIVVRLCRILSIDGKKFYIVVEGNRRIAALKWLIDLHDSGKETFSEEQLDNFTNLKVLLLDENAPDNSKWILPGLRHVSGIKEWGAYQKARAVYELREAGYSSKDSAQSLGLSTKSANLMWRAYLALEQMKSDDEYGEYAEPKKYSYFEEIFKRPNLRDWLGWDDDQKKFVNSNRLIELYSWIVDEKNEDGDISEAKIPMAINLRELSKFIDDENVLNIFRGPGGSLIKALAKYEVEHPQDWHPIISKCESVLTGFTPDVLRKFTKEDISLIKKLQHRVEQVFADHETLTRFEHAKIETVA
ncbi:MAG: hypothetical protein HQL05_14740 [Nitrospirae bacterium]|uniref:hypothetical protein n=1 Tax=Candidatus Magnetobacterium casense TaxID=1455061 RepID=UPI00058B6B78|nr:hypothetical protein [Candidatus Magnetobacterium casensis]MBF0339073.1 hypothetical protein [Nitrospirota bacterium]